MSSMACGPSPGDHTTCHVNPARYVRPLRFVCGRSQAFARLKTRVTVGQFADWSARLDKIGEPPMLRG